MKNKIYIGAAISLVILISGCASSQHGARNLNDLGRYTTIQKGKTTKKEVYISFGQPHDVEYKPDNSSVWRYFQATTSSSAASFIPFVGLIAGGVDSQTMSSRFEFDNTELFSKLTTTDIKKTTNMWSLMGSASEAAKTDKKPERVAEEMKKLNFPFDENLAKSMVGMEILAD